MSISAGPGQPALPLARREVWRACLLLALIVLLAHSRGLTGDRLAGEADTLRSGYPLRDHFWSIVARGELPTWTPYLMGGYPLIVEEETVPFYPPEWIFGLFQTPAAYNWMLAVTFWLAAVGAYLLARNLAISPGGAWVVALVTIFGAPLVARVEAGHNAHLYGRSLMIWHVWAMTHLARKPGWWGAVGLAIPFGTMLLIGVGLYQQILYTALLSALFGVYLLLNRVRPGRRLRFVAWGGLAVIMGLALGAATTGITLDVLTQGNRQGGLSDEDLDHGSLPWLMVMGYALPHTFDDPAITDYAWPEYALYVGTGTLLLAYYALRKRGHERAVRWWGGITLLFVWLALGSGGGLFRLFVEVIPGYGLVRNPSRHAMVAGLGLAILAGYGFDGLLNERLGPISLRQKRLALAGIGLALGMILLMVIVQVPETEKSFDVFPQRLLRGAAWLIAALIAFRLAARLHRSQPGQATRLLLLGVLAFDLAAYAYPILYSGAKPGALAYITPDNLPASAGRSAAFLEAGDPADWGRANVAAENGLPLLNTYSSVMPQRMIGAINLLAGRPADTYQENHIMLDAVARPDLLDLFGVQWLLVNADLPLPDDSSLREGENFGRVRSVENPDALPFAFVVPEVLPVGSADESLRWLEQAGRDYRQQGVIEGTLPPAANCPAYTVSAEQVTDLRLEGGNLWLDVETPQAGILSINQTYQRGWQGWINGQETTVYPVNYRWLGVYLPCPGRYQVHLRYLPTSFIIGLLVSGLTLPGMGIISLWVWWCGRRQKRMSQG